MTEPKDVFDENLSKLLRGAEGPPDLPAGRKEQMLRELQTQLAPAPLPGRGRTVMNRFFGVLSRAASAAAILLILVGTALFLTWGPRPETRPAEPTPPSTELKKDRPAPIAGKFSLADGTLLYARGKPKYTVLGERHLRLEEGQILLFVAWSREPFVVETAQARAEAHGTTFTIAAGAESTFVAVGQGRVKLSNAEGSVEVRAGQQAEAEKSEPPQREPAPRFSYLVNWARQFLQGKKLFETEEHASGELIVVDPWGQRARLELRKYHVDVVIENGIARTTIDQTFFNHLTWQIEGTFYFPLPPDASLSRLAMYVNGKLNEGGMVERQYGRHVYESIVYRRRDPALLEMMEGNVFKMRVFPIFGRQEKRIIISYTQTLAQLYNTLRYWFPMEHTNDKAGQLTFRVRVKNAAGKVKALSSTHRTETLTDGNDLLVTYGAQDVAPNQDFLLHLVPEVADWGLPFAAFKQNGRRYLHARLDPDLAGAVDSRPRQWFIINDVSASRSSVDVKAQAYILERLLEEADDDDTFALINLDTRVRVWQPHLVSVRDARGPQAVAFAGVAERLGATNLQAGLDTIARLIEQTGAENPHLVYLGDGVATDEVTEPERLVTHLPEGAVFIGLGVGKKVDARFLQAAADATTGLFTTISPSEDVRWRIFDLIASLNTPRLVEIKTAFEDARGRAMKLEAYPSTGTLCEGEVLTILARMNGDLPARLVLTGRVGREKFEKRYDLASAGVEAAYAPRFWASARINHLLRESAAEYKDEIIKLAKEFYVVTPFTSLIVLENEADYKKWKVEMGRKDHWQLYPAPKTIEVVKEPLERRPRIEPPTPPVKGTPGHPKTIEEIVNSVQFRVHVPLYGYYPYQDQSWRTQRFHLHALLSGRLPAAGYGTVTPQLLMTDEDRTGGGVWAFPVTTIHPTGDLGGLGTDQGLFQRQLPMGGERSGRILTHGLPFEVNGKYGLGSLGPAIRERYADLQSIMPGYLDGGRLLGLPLLGEIDSMPLRRAKWRLTPLMLRSRLREQVGKELAWPYGGFVTSPYLTGSEVALDGKRSREFDKARLSRWLGDRARIRQVNRRYGGGHDDWGWGTLEHRRLRTQNELARTWLPMVRLTGLMGKEFRPSIEVPEPGPAGVMAGEMLPALLPSYARAMGAVPGTLAALTADYWLPLREKLRAMEPSEKRDQAIAAIDAFLKKLPELSATTEDTGTFWSHRGWGMLPARWEFVQPQAQAWSGSRAMTDLTRYAPALESTWGDVLALVLEAFGQQPEGRVDEAAAERIAAARRNTPTMRIQYVTKKGEVLFQLWAGSDDRFAWTSRSSMHLREDFVCDGKNLYHLYPELGLAARRPAGQRRAGLRGLVPHLMPPAKELARHFNVKLEKTDGPLTTLRLTPIPRKEEEPAKPTAVQAKTPDLAILITFDDRGFLQEQVWSVDGETKLTCTYTYKDSEVEATFTAKDKSVRAFAYRYQVPQMVGNWFTPDLKDLVVIEMPLRTTAHYQALLKEIEKDPQKLDARTNLRRHLALAQLQDYGWQYPWGAVQPAYQAVLAGLEERRKAGQKKVALGDVTLIGSAGYAYALHNQRQNFGLPSSDRLLRYWLNSGNAAELKKLAAESPGTFVGHLAAYCRVHRASKEQLAAARQFIKDYPDSPLLYAAAVYSGRSEFIWLELAKQPRWRFLALCTAAQHKPTPKVAAAFEAHHKELTEKGWEVPISSRMAVALKTDAGRWQRVIKRWFKLAMKSKDVGALLRFAEFAYPHNEKDLASVALDRAREFVGEKLPLTWKLTLAQSLWAMGRTQEAWQEYEAILAALKEKGLEPSPALLATAARLAQQTGKPGRAVDFELRALEAEEPYMPKQINVHLFRQRYQWLWNQLVQRADQAAQAVKAKPESEDAKRELREALARALHVWRTWQQTDTTNTQLYRQLATLYRSAGDEAAAWRALSTLIDEKPKDGQSYYQVGQWYVSQNDRDAGQRWYAKAYEVEPTNGDWIWRRAELLRQMNRKHDARRLYAEIAKKKWQPRFQHYNQKAKDRLRKL